MGILSSIGKGISKVLDTTTVALAHPVKTLTAVVSSKSTVADVVTEHFNQSLTKQITQTIAGTIAIGATVATAGATGVLGKAAAASAPAKVVATAAKALIPKTAKQTLVAAAVVPIAATAIISNPQAAASVPSKVLNFQTNVGELIASPSIAKAKETFMENPIISSAVVAGGVAVAGLATAGVVSSVLNTQAIQEQTKALNSQIPNALPTTPASTAGSSSKEYQNNNPSPVEARPVTPSTMDINKKRSRKTRKILKNNVVQRVNVIVSNRSSSTGIRGARYLNQRILN